MKKFLFLSMILLFSLTACDMDNMETLKCSYENTRNNITTKTTYNIDYVGSNVKKLRVTYDYHQDIIVDNDGNGKEDIDGVNTGTDGTTSDTQIDEDGIIDGVVGSAIDSIVDSVVDTILDISGIKERHATVKNTYGNIPGFSVQTTSDDTDNNYKVTYIIDYDVITDDDLRTLDLSRDIDSLRRKYTSQGFICED